MEYDSEASSLHDEGGKISLRGIFIECLGGWNMAQGRRHYMLDVGAGGV